MFDIKEHSHTRLNILTGDWILDSPYIMKLPLQGKVEDLLNDSRESYDPNCNLCPTNKRMDGTHNPDYKDSLSFVNDFSALLSETPIGGYDDEELLIATTIQRPCQVIIYSSPKNCFTMFDGPPIRFSKYSLFHRFSFNSHTNISFLIVSFSTYTNSQGFLVLV